jgi:hypothetical protein
MGTPFKMKGFSGFGSPMKTRLGRWLMGRKKHDVSYDTPGGKGTGRGTMITDKHGYVVKTKTDDGVTTIYKKGSRPQHPTIR